MLLFADPADGHQDVNALSRYGYCVFAPSDIVVSSAGGRTSGGYIGIKSNGLILLPSTLGSACWLSFAMYVPAAPSSSSNSFVSVYNEEDTVNANLRVRLTPGGGFTLLDAAGSTAATSSNGLWTVGAWHHVEIGMAFDNATGGVSIKVDGVLVFTHSSADTYNGDADTIAFQRGIDTGGSTIRLDDIAVWDATVFGADPFVESVGDIRMATLVPTQDVAAGNGWTSSGGPGFASKVAASDDDSSYAEHAVPSSGAELNEFTLGHAGAPSDVYQVLAAGVIAESRRTAQGAATDSSGAAQPMYSPVLRGEAAQSGIGGSFGLYPQSISGPQDYATHVSAAFADPSTGGAFTKASIDGASFGVRAQSGGG